MICPGPDVTAKVTGSPEVAVATRFWSAAPKVVLASAAKLIVWLALLTVMVCATLGAAR